MAMFLASRLFGAPATLFAVGLVLSAPALAQEPCGLCNDEVRLTPPLADCFLDRYEEIADGGGGAVVVDLSPCGQDRSVVDALPNLGAGPAAAEPDVQFILTRAQLGCLKARLEERPTFDGVATFDLKAC
ncbi:MAG: hypothetical protein ABTQ31_11670 [Rhizobiaceae bacterium]